MSITCALSLCLDLGPGALKVPKEADEGGRAASGSARRGKRQHASPQNPLLDCSLCGKVFSSASSLSKHYLTHSQERKHVCKICGKAFKRQDHLYVGVWSGGWGGGSGRAPGWPSHLPWVGFPSCRPDRCLRPAQGHRGAPPLLTRGQLRPGRVAPPSPQGHTSEETAATVCRRDPRGFQTCNGSLPRQFCHVGNWAHFYREMLGVPRGHPRRTDPCLMRSVH